MNYFEFCKKYDIDLNKEQAKAVQQTEGPLLMISVPGSGKTTVMITRIAYMILCNKISPEKILTVTFSVDAAASMKERYINKFSYPVSPVPLPEFRTIHSLALNIVKLYCYRKNKIPYKILTDPFPAVKCLIKNDISYPHCNDRTVKDILGCISKYRNLSSEEFIKEKSIDGVDAEYVYDLYNRYKQENRFMDFDDILVNAVKILENDPDILHHYQKKYKYINVDEAQDNSKIQNRIIDLLASGNSNVFMAGDEDQCIYGFRGAYPQSFFDFEKKWGSKSIIKLQTNYRSCRKILRTAESFISQNKNRYDKELNGVKTEEGKAEVKYFKNLKEMNDHILNDMSGYRSAAVLSRNNDQLLPIAYTLYKNEVDFNIGAGKNEFFNSSYINDIIVIVKKGLGLGVKHIPYHLQPLLNNEKHLYYLRSLAPSAALRFIIQDMHYSKVLVSKYKERHSSQEICSKLCVLEYIAGHYEDLRLFSDGLDNFKDFLSNSRSGGNISLLTCHGSKGLEFDKVYLTGVYENIFPASDPADPDLIDTECDIEEEVRLFYVAITRARNELEILNVKNSSWGVSFPSIFVKRIEGYIKGYEIKQHKWKTQ